MIIETSISHNKFKNFDLYIFHNGRYISIYKKRHVIYYISRKYYYIPSIIFQ